MELPNNDELDKMRARARKGHRSLRDLRTDLLCYCKRCKGRVVRPWSTIKQHLKTYGHMNDATHGLNDENTPLAGGSGLQNHSSLSVHSSQNILGSQGSSGSAAPPPSPEPRRSPYRAPLSPIYNRSRTSSQHPSARSSRCFASGKGSARSSQQSTPKSAPYPSGYHYCSPQDPALSQSTLHNPYNHGHRSSGDLYSDLLGSGPPPPPPPSLGSQPSNEEDNEEDNRDPFQLDDPDHLDPPDYDPGPDQGDMGEDEPIFQPFDDPPDPPAPDDPENENERPAFAEHPDLQNFYIRTFILSAFKGVTEDAIAEILLSHKAALLAQDSRGELAPELSQGLARFPLTLWSLRHRLGMNVDRFIRVYALCPACGTRYSMEEINNMAGMECPKEWDGEPCGAGLYVESILYGGVRKRSPCKSYPYIPFPGALERFLLRPGAFEWIQSWRRQGHPEDEPAEVPPTTRRVWMLNMPVDQMFGDISQGWAYRAIPCGLERHYNARTGTYEDIPTDDGHPLAIVMLPGGVTGLVNFDGFQVVRNGKYSVNGVYIMISTLPFHLRIKPENMILVAVMPGPKEPSKYEFDQIMQPFIDDLIELGQGVNMQVHNMATGHPEERLIHFSLSSMVVDSIARIKGCGHAGVKSKNIAIYEQHTRISYCNLVWV